MAHKFNHGFVARLTKDGQWSASVAKVHHLSVIFIGVGHFDNP
jgi:hypothetical protein